MNFMRKERKVLFVMLAVLCILALSLGMALISAPARALAAEGDVIEVQFNGEITTYTTVKDALSYVEELETSEENRALIKLLDNYTLGANGDDSRFKIDISTFAALDLNGYILRGSGSASVIGIYGDMILEDSQSESTAEEHQHDYYVDESGLWVVDDESAEWQEAYDAAENKGTITGGVITGGNSANYGGGIYLNLYGASGGGILTMNGGTIAGNQADWGAGGVFVNRNTGFEMNGGIIAGNITLGSSTLGLGYGGGIMINDPPIKHCVINGGVIKENVANIGGGITSAYTENLITITGGEIVNNYAPQAGGLYISGTLKMSGGEIYGNEAETGIHAISAVSIAVSGGKISGDISFVIIEGITNTIEITSGYYAEGVEYGEENGNTVSGFSVAEGYAVVLLDENSGDENYSAEFPYAVYRIGSGGEVSFDVSGVSTSFDGGQITAGEDFVLSATSGGTPIGVSEIAYSYSTDGASFVEGLPSDAGTYTVKASVSGIIDAQNKVYYEGAEYTFAYEITPVQLTVAGVTVSVDGNDTVSVDSFSVVGIMEGTDVSVIVESCTLLDDGRVHIVYALSGSDAANYIVPADTYTTVQQSGLEEVNAAIASLNAAIEALKSSVASSDAALQSSISSLRSRLDQAVSQLEKSIADGDKANADALLAAKDELQKAFEAADAVLEGKIGELGEADKTLQAAIDAIDAAYKAADEALAGAIEELRAENAAQDDTIARQEEQLNSLSVVLWVTLAVAVVAFGVGAAGLVFGLKAKKKD